MSKSNAVHAVMSVLCLSTPTVVDDLQERSGACNGKGAQVLGAHVASMTSSDSRQTRKVDPRRDEKTAAEFPQH